MGYKIIYNSPNCNAGQNRSKMSRIRVLTAVFLLIGCLLVRTTWSQGTDLIKSLLLPGEPTVTEQAFAEMMDDLTCGVSWRDAVTGFCSTVISDGAEISS